MVEAITAHAPFCKAFDSAVGAVATEVAGMTACCPVRQVVAIVSLFHVTKILYVCFCSILLREKNIWTKKTGTLTLHWNSCIVPAVLRVKRLAIQ